MHEYNDQKDVFCKIGSHLGDVDVDPNTPKSEDGSFLSGDSGKVFSTNQSYAENTKTNKNNKKRSLQPNQQKKKDIEHSPIIQSPQDTPLSFKYFPSP